MARIRFEHFLDLFSITHDVTKRLKLTYITYMFYPQSVCLCDQHSGAGAALGRSTLRRFEVLIPSRHRPHCHEGKGNST